MDIPNGVVTFVFSDIEGSTRLWESDPDGMSRSLTRHDEIVRGVVEEQGGVLFKHTGDGFGAAFGSATSGVTAAAGVAAALAAERWEGPSLACRIGVHTGEAEPRDGDYFGPTVTRTARLMDAGNGGQIVVSETTRRLIADRAPTGTVFVDAGEHRLKDLGEPITISRMVGTGAEDDRDLRTLERAPHNLPTQLSSFIGRESQIKEVAALVRESRLTTLTGIGGVGKTRLALQVAAEVLGEFVNGAWLVELAALTDPALVADAVADALAIPQDSAATPERRVLKFLTSRRALLIVDNCEHVIDAVATFANNLLQACPDVHILATSREGLGVMGEALWRVPSLRVDDDGAAVELFAERARLVQPNFAVNDHNLPAVADICARLDGIPLAIELATARLTMLSVEQIAEHLGDRFRLLTGGSRTAVERQRTLRAMMDWSHDLLSAQEQTLLRRLSVFSDGFTYKAAEEVCVGDSISRLEVLDTLGRLVQASLVVFETDPSPRYRLLETVRQYALDQLFEAAETESTRLRHAEHFRHVSQTIDQAFEQGEVTGLDVGDEELGNLRAALTWALEAGEGTLALEVACNLKGYFWSKLMFRETVRWITSALAIVDDTECELVPLGVAYALTDATNVRDLNVIRALLPRVERLLEADLSDAARGALANAMGAYVMAENPRRADEWFRRAYQLLRASDSPRWFAPVQNRMQTAWFMNSREHEEEVLDLARQAAAEGTAIHDAVVQIAFLVLAEEYEQVIQYVDSHRARDDWEDGMFHIFGAHAERATGRYDNAARTLERAEALFGSDLLHGIQWESAMLRLHDNDVAGAIAAFELPYEDDGSLFDASNRLRATDFWTIIAARRGDYVTAALLSGYADALKTDASMDRLAADARIIEASVRSARDALGKAAFDEHHRRGQEATWHSLPLVRGAFIADSHD